VTRVACTIQQQELFSSPARHKTQHHMSAISKLNILNTKNVLNIQNTSTTSHNIKTSRSTFATSAWNNCGIILKHLKHVEHTLATCAKPYCTPWMYPHRRTANPLRQAIPPLQPLLSAEGVATSVNSAHGRCRENRAPPRKVRCLRATCHGPNPPTPTVRSNIFTQYHLSIVTTVAMIVSQSIGWIDPDEHGNNYPLLRSGRYPMGRRLQWRLPTGVVSETQLIDEHHAVDTKQALRSRTDGNVVDTQELKQTLCRWGLLMLCTSSGMSGLYSRCLSILK
jgi:hypothetical protein